MARRFNKSSIVSPVNIILCVMTSLLLALAAFLYHAVFGSPTLFRPLRMPGDDVNLSNFTTIHIGNTSATEESKEATETATHKFKILIGILTMASKVERRSILRMAYAGQSSDDAVVTVRFVMGALKNNQEKIMVGMENTTYGDIIVLDCPENLNEGKTFTYFSSLPGMGLKYDYVMKTDDDSYVRIENLGRNLKSLPRTDLYYGYILPCENQDPYAWYMAGMGYLISWDLVEWIEKSPIPRNRSVGTEDKLVADWFNEGDKAKNRVNDKPLFYDHPDFGGKCAHELIPETILIHQVKTAERWADVLAFFENGRILEGLSGSPSESGDHRKL